MPIELKLPLLGDVMQEGTLAVWLKSDGERVERGEPIYQLETDKVTYAVEAPESGFLRHVVTEGSVVPVGTVVGQITQDADVEVRASPAARRVARELGVDIASMGATRRIREADVRAFREQAPPAAEVQATPAARRVAREHGVDLTRLNGGRLIREQDVLNAVSADEPAPSPRTQRQLSGRRRVIAERMHASLQQMAQLTVSMEVDFTLALQLRAQLEQLWPADAQPTITDLVMRAAVLALKDHPRLNATLEEHELREHASVHLGLAVDADEGLIVPVVRAAETLGLRELAERTRDLASRARANRLTLDDVQGGTFTVTTLGQLGVDFFTPIVNPPEVAILGIGRVFARLVLRDGHVEERSAMTLNLSFDHRAVDGAPAARFLKEVKRLLELPAALVL
jgi:pyruvate dehydrogenase E2 component (dihydrolipoamide acetyltransferase)